MSLSFTRINSSEFTLSLQIHCPPVSIIVGLQLDFIHGEQQPDIEGRKERKFRAVIPLAAACGVAGSWLIPSSQLLLAALSLQPLPLWVLVTADSIHPSVQSGNGVPLFSALETSLSYPM